MVTCCSAPQIGVQRRGDFPSPSLTPALAGAGGFTLVEILVALLVLMVGALGAASTAVLAVRLLDSVHTEERAAQAAALVLDSLLHAPDPTSGERELDGFRLRWETGAGDAADPIEVVVEYDDGRTSRQLVLGALGPTPTASRDGGVQP